MNETHQNKELAAIISNYEDYISTLTSQIQTYKEEHDVLKHEVKNILAENNKLASKVSDFTANALENVPHSFTATHFGDNVKLQLDLALKEKEATLELWQDSLRTIDYLETELKLCRNSTPKQKPRQDFHLLQNEYEKQTKDLEKLTEAKKCMSELLRKSQNDLESREEELEKTKQDLKCSKKIVKKLDCEINEIREKQTDVINMKDNILRTLDGKTAVINELKLKGCEYKRNLNEALQLVEAALIEKDAALQRETQTKEEMAKLTKVMAEMVDETREKVKNEVELIETKYKLKLKKVHLDCDHLKEQIAEKSQEIFACKRNGKILEEELERFKKGNITLDESNTTKLLLLEKNLESTFQKLLVSEKNNQQLIAERDNIKHNLEQMADCYQQDVKLKEVEKITLETKIKNSQSELQKSNVNLMHLINKVNDLNNTIECMRSEMDARIDLKERMNAMKFNNKIGEIYGTNHEIQVKLKQQLKMQIELNNKWKNEVHEITDKLEKRIIELRAEVALLKKQKKELETQLQHSISKLKDYKTGLDSLCTDVNNAVFTCNKNSDLN